MVQPKLTCLSDIFKYKFTTDYDMVFYFTAYDELTKTFYYKEDKLKQSFIYSNDITSLLNIANNYWKVIGYSPSEEKNLQSKNPHFKICTKIKELENRSRFTNLKELENRSKLTNLEDMCYD